MPVEVIIQRLYICLVWVLPFLITNLILYDKIDPYHDRILDSQYTEKGYIYISVKLSLKLIEFVSILLLIYAVSMVFNIDFLSK